MFSLICRHQIKGKHYKGIGLWAHDKSKSTQGRYEDSFSALRLLPSRQRN
jgi:hypothetical protein